LSIWFLYEILSVRDCFDFSSCHWLSFTGLSHFSSVMWNLYRNISTPRVLRSRSVVDSRMRSYSDICKTLMFVISWASEVPGLHLLCSFSSCPCSLIYILPKMVKSNWVLISYAVSSTALAISISHSVNMKILLLQRVLGFFLSLCTL